jgi:uncharacterized repeat protein (TIGR02543 family)
MNYLKICSAVAFSFFLMTGCIIDITSTVTYSVTYKGNNNTGGSVPTDSYNYASGEYVNVMGKNSLVRTGYTFAGWNTSSNGTGTSYDEGETFVMGSADKILYAMWNSTTTYYNVNYYGNTYTSGTAPVDPYDYAPGENVTVLGKNSLVKTGYTFTGWNTSSSGSGTSYDVGETFVMGSSDKSLYAMWEQNYYVNSYVTIPDAVRGLIYESVNGYTMPPVSTYGTAIYPSSAVYDASNLPSYVKADFNDDGFYDYAYMFSMVSSSGGVWTLNTKLIMVVSTATSYKVALEEKLSTTSTTKPTEEFWGIRLLKAGTHTITTNGKTVSVELANDALYLGSVEPTERTIYYMDNGAAIDMLKDLGAIPKKKIILPGNASTEITIKTIKAVECN